MRRRNATRQWFTNTPLLAKPATRCQIRTGCELSLHVNGISQLEARLHGYSKGMVGGIWLPWPLKCGTIAVQHHCGRRHGRPASAVHLKGLVHDTAIWCTVCSQTACQWIVIVSQDVHSSLTCRGKSFIVSATACKPPTRIKSVPLVYHAQLICPTMHHHSHTIAIQTLELWLNFW